MVAAERETLGIIDGIVCESDVEHGEGLLLTGCVTAWAENRLVGSTLRVEQVGQTLHVTKQGRSVGEGERGVDATHVVDILTRQRQVRDREPQTVTSHVCMSLDWTHSLSTAKAKRRQAGVRPSLTGRCEGFRLAPHWTHPKGCCVTVPKECCCREYTSPA